MALAFGQDQLTHKEKTQADWVYASMPAVLRFLGLRVVIYPNDHRPPHVHVMSQECEVVFHLQCPHGPPELRENFGFTRSQLKSIAEFLAGELMVLCTRWRDIHESN